MRRFDKAVIKRFKERLDLTETEAKEWENMIKCLECGVNVPKHNSHGGFCRKCWERNKNG